MQFKGQNINTGKIKKNNKTLNDNDPQSYFFNNILKLQTSFLSWSKYHFFQLYLLKTTSVHKVHGHFVFPIPYLKKVLQQYLHMAQTINFSQYPSSLLCFRNGKPLFPCSPPPYPMHKVLAEKKSVQKVAMVSNLVSRQFCMTRSAISDHGTKIWPMGCM